MDPGKVELCTFSKPVLETQISASLVLVWFGAAMSNPPKKEKKRAREVLVLLSPLLSLRTAVCPSISVPGKSVSFCQSVCLCLWSIYRPERVDVSQVRSLEIYCSQTSTDLYFFFSTQSSVVRSCLRTFTRLGLNRRHGMTFVV